MNSPETLNIINDTDHDTPLKTPSERTNLSVSVSRTQKEKVDFLDGGCCIVTNIWNPPTSVQYVRIISTTTPDKDLRWLEIVWGVPRGELQLSSSRNVLHLSCDWRVTFDQGHWALVPILSVLADISLRFIIATENGKTAYPSPPDMLQSSERTAYCLVFFEPLAGRVYQRATNKGQTEFDEITVDETGISPPFEHHCHPYFAAWNAISKFRKHQATLSRQQKLMHVRLELLMDDWTIYFTQVKDKGLDKKIDDTQHLSQRQELPPTPPITSSLEESEESFFYADWSHVAKWLADVADECNPVEEQSVEWPLDEIPRPPAEKYVSLDDWPIPPDTSKFSSTNWAKWILETTLTRSLSSSECSR